MGVERAVVIASSEQRIEDSNVVMLQNRKVDLGNPDNGDVPVYNTITNAWEPQPQGASSFNPILNIVTTSDTVSELSGFVIYDCTNESSVIDLQFPSAAGGITAIYVIKNRSTSQNVTLTPSGGETIEGANPYTLNPGEAVMLYSDTSNLIVF